MALYHTCHSFIFHFSFGSDELKRLFLAPSISGDFVACVGVSEPGAGSDVARMQSNARQSGDDWIINGQKMWITNGMQADWMCVLVNTSKDGGPHKNKSMFCLPLNTKGKNEMHEDDGIFGTRNNKNPINLIFSGITRTKIANKLGMHSSDTAQFFFDDVRVPQKYMIGEEGMGFVYQMLQFQNERLWGMVSLLKAFDKCIQATIDYAKQRKMFGQSLLDFQSVHFRMAELLTEVEALRSMCYRALGKPSFNACCSNAICKMQLQLQNAVFILHPKNQLSLHVQLHRTDIFFQAAI